MSKVINLSGLKTLLEPLVHMINKKAERPDWNENDPNSPDYIENKPFYESVKQQLVAEFTSDSTDLSGTMNSSMADAGLYAGYMYSSELSMLPPESVFSAPQFFGKFDIIPNQQYDVIYKGQTYNLIAKKYVVADYVDADFTYIGDDSIVDSFLSGGQLSEGARFCFLVTDMSDGYQESIFLTTAPEIADVTICRQVCEIHKIDEKYLPEIIGKAGTGVHGEIFNCYDGNSADGAFAHAEGLETTATGDSSHAEGQGTCASSSTAHAEGNHTTASGIAAHVEGQISVASGINSHAEGYDTHAHGGNSHSEGRYTYANGLCSHTEGDGTIASGAQQHVQGKYNISDTSSAHIVGNGTDSARSNAHTIDWSGNAWYAGDVYVGSTSGTNKDAGSKKLATEDYVTTLVGETPVSEQIASALSNVSAPVTSVNGATGDVVVDSAINGATLIRPLDTTQSFGYEIVTTADNQRQFTLRYRTSDSVLYYTKPNGSTVRIFNAEKPPTADQVGARPNTWMPGYADVGAAAASHTHDYLPLSGGELTGALSTTGNITAAAGKANQFVIGGGDSYVWMDNRAADGTVQNNLVLYPEKTLTKKDLYVNSNKCYHGGNLSFSLSGTTLTITKS